VTGGATIENVSLWTNETGVWAIRNTTNATSSISDDIHMKFNNNLNNDGSASIITDSTGTVAYETGVIEQAYNSSAGNYFSINGSSIFDFGTGNFSMAFWFKNADDTFYVMDEANNGQGIRILATGSGGINLVLETTGGITTKGDGDADITDGAWHHVAFTRDGTNLSSYVDSIWTKNVSSNTDVSVGDMIMGIISTGDASEVDALDDLRIYKDKVLSKAQIDLLYNSGSGDEANNIGVFSSTETYTNTITAPTLWTCQACDSDGDCGFALENRTVLIDTVEPTINITYPEEDMGVGNIGDNETFNWTATDDNIDTCWYEYNDTNTTVTCGDNTTHLY